MTNPKLRQAAEEVHAAERTLNETVEKAKGLKAKSRQARRKLKDAKKAAKQAAKAARAAREAAEQAGHIYRKTVAKLAKERKKAARAKASIVTPKRRRTLTPAAHISAG